MKRVIAALQFLTSIYLPVKTDLDDFGNSVPFFPIAGTVIGVGSAVIFWGGSYLDLSCNMSALLTVIALILLSGALHLDGVADSFDGLFSHRKPERMLEIMRDSSIGTMGVLGLVVVVLLKIFAISEYGYSYNSYMHIILATTISRGAMAFTVYFGKYLRESGMAVEFIKRKSLGNIFILFIIIFTIIGLINFVYGLSLFIIAIVTALIFNMFVYRKIGGMTGDTIGATSEIVETVLLLVPLLYKGIQ